MMPQDDRAAAGQVAELIRDELKRWNEIEMTDEQWVIVLRALDAMADGARAVPNSAERWGGMVI